MPPLGIAELSTQLLNKNIEVETCDLELLAYNHNIHLPVQKLMLDKLTMPCKPDELESSVNDFAIKESLSTLVKYLPLTGINLVCFSVMGQRQFFSSIRISYYLRNKGIFTAMGGCFANLNKKTITEFNGFNFVLLNSSSESLVDICRKLDTGYFNNSQNESKYFSGDPESEIETPTYSKNITTIYPTTLQNMYSTAKPNLILQHRIDQGCNRQCSFCTRHSHDNYNAINIDKFIKSLSKIKADYNPKLFSLVTNSININPRFSEKLLREIIRASLKINYYTYATPTKISHQLVKLLVESGCKILRFGVESGSNNILKNMKKKFTVEDIEWTLKAVHDTGIWTQVNLIVGYPNESTEDNELTCKFIERNHKVIDSIRVNPFYLQSGSEIHLNPEKYNIKITNHSGNKVTFHEINGLNFIQKTKHTVGFIDEIYKRMSFYNIGYTGILINLLMAALYENKTKEGTLNWFKKQHPFVFENIPYETIRWLIYHKHEVHKNPFGNNWADYYGITFEENY